MTLSLITGTALLMALQPAARAAQGAEFITAVSSTASKGYVRVKLADGTVKPEEYCFGNGGKWSGSYDDETIDKLGFMDVAGVIASPLAALKSIFPAKDATTTKRLIMVYWGATQVAERIQDTAAFMEYGRIRTEIAANLPPQVTKIIKITPDASTSAMNDPPIGGDDTQMAELTSAVTMISLENKRRARLDYKNAEMLGYDIYDAGGLVGTDKGTWIGNTPLGAIHRDEVAEIEASSYFVVLMAYDFQMAWKQKKHKLLWETRFSINQVHNDFSQALPAMAQYASRYFGQNSHGLIRESIREGDVTVGEPTLVELLSEPKK